MSKISLTNLPLLPQLTPAEEKEVLGWLDNPVQRLQLLKITEAVLRKAAHELNVDEQKKNEQTMVGKLRAFIKKFQ